MRERLRAPLATILPSFVPVLLERGVPGYEGSALIEGEKRLSGPEIAALLVASAYLGAEEHAAAKNLDHNRVRSSLSQSLQGLTSLLPPAEIASAFRLLHRFNSYRIIREDHSFDDWLCEALWEEFQNIPYTYPSAMSNAIAYGLTIRETLHQCVLEY